jgi:hypothetical protein
MDLKNEGINAYSYRTFGSQLSFMARLADVCKTKKKKNSYYCLLSCCTRL